jgi:hypothetical protein
MTAACAIAAFVLFASPVDSVPIRPEQPVCLAAGDALGMQLMEAVPADLSVHSTRLVQATQHDGWWTMPAGMTVVANFNSR